MLCNELFNEIILGTAEKSPGFFLYIKGAFTRVFQLLGSSDLYSVDKIHSEASQQEYLATKIIHVLEANHGHCTREQLTNQLHYTGEYINRIFKKYTGKTISEYRQAHRQALASNTEKGAVGNQCSCR